MPEANSDSNNADGGKKPKSLGLKIAGALSVVLWIVGFVLPFIIPEGSPYVWVSDTFLLTGFLPLLFIYPAGWPWVVFGVLNMAIGFGLEIVLHLQIPEEVWNPQNAQYRSSFEQMHKHINAMHPMLPWLIIGFLSTIYGIARMVKNTARWIAAKMAKN